MKRPQKMLLVTGMENGEPFVTEFALNEELPATSIRVYVFVTCCSRCDARGIDYRRVLGPLLCPSCKGHARARHDLQA